MALISDPPNNTSVDQNGDQIAQPWASWFSAVSSLLIALTGSGTTVRRPIKLLWVGRPFFDTTLGYEIHYNGNAWVRWDGVVV